MGLLSCFGDASLPDHAIRPLGNLEIYQSTIHRLDHYRGTAVCGTYTVPAAAGGTAAAPDRDPDHPARNLVERAIARVVAQHPVLTVGVADVESKRPYWVPLPGAVDVRQWIEWRQHQQPQPQEGDDRDGDDGDLRDLETRLDRRWENQDTTPGWRVVITPCSQTTQGRQLSLNVAFIFNHTHIDGTGGLIFHQSLLAHLNNPDNHQCNSPLSENNAAEKSKAPTTTTTTTTTTTNPWYLVVPPTSTSPAALPPCQNDLVVWPVGLRYTLKTVWKELGPSSGAAPPDPATTTKALWAPHRGPGAALDPSSPPRTRLRRFAVPAPVLGRVVAACRGRGVTVTSLLHGICLVSFAGRVGVGMGAAEGGGWPGGFAGGTAVSTRRAVWGEMEKMEKEKNKGKGKDGKGKKKGRAKAGGWSGDPNKTMANFVTSMGHEFSPEMVARVRAIIVEGRRERNQKRSSEVQAAATAEAEAEAEAEAPGEEVTPKVPFSATAAAATAVSSSSPSTSTSTSTSSTSSSPSALDPAAAAAAAAIPSLEPSIWAAALQVRGELRRRAELGVRDDVAGLMKLIGDWPAEMAKVVRKPRSWSWCVTNLGAFDGREAAGFLPSSDYCSCSSSSSSSEAAAHPVGGAEGKEEEDCGDKEKEKETKMEMDERWRIERAEFHLSAESPAAALCLSPVAVKGGELVMSFGWQDGVIADEVAEGVIADVRWWLERIGGGVEEK